CRTYIVPSSQPSPRTMRTSEPIRIGRNTWISAPDELRSSARPRTTRPSVLGPAHDSRSHQRIAIRCERLRSASFIRPSSRSTHIKPIFFLSVIEPALPYPVSSGPKTRRLIPTLQGALHARSLVQHVGRRPVRRQDYSMSAATLRRRP